MNQGTTLQKARTYPRNAQIELIEKEVLGDLKFRYQLLTGGVTNQVLQSLLKHTQHFYAAGGSMAVISADMANALGENFRPRRNIRAVVECYEILEACSQWALVAYNKKKKIVGVLSFEIAKNGNGNSSIDIEALVSTKEIAGTGSALEVVIAHLAVKGGFFVSSEYNNASKKFHQKIGRWIGGNDAQNVMLSFWSAEDVAKIAKHISLKGKESFTLSTAGVRDTGGLKRELL